MHAQIQLANFRFLREREEEGTEEKEKERKEGKRESKNAGVVVTGVHACTCIPLLGSIRGHT